MVSWYDDDGAYRKLKAGDAVWVTQESSWRFPNETSGYYDATVKRTTKTQLIVSVNLYGGDPKEMRFNRVTGREVGGKRGECYDRIILKTAERASAIAEHKQRERLGSLIHAARDERWYQFLSPDQVEKAIAFMESIRPDGES